LILCWVLPSNIRLPFIISYAFAFCRTRRVHMAECVLVSPLQHPSSLPNIKGSCFSNINNRKIYCIVCLQPSYFPKNIPWYSSILSFTSHYLLIFKQLYHHITIFRSSNLCNVMEHEDIHSLRPYFCEALCFPLSVHRFGTKVNWIFFQWNWIYLDYSMYRYFMHDFKLWFTDLSFCFL
jgi:hypothetical protein